MTTSSPARAHTSAMPEPMRPQPTTPTRSMFLSPPSSAVVIAGSPCFDSRGHPGPRANQLRAGTRPDAPVPGEGHSPGTRGTEPERKGGIRPTRSRPLSGRGLGGGGGGLAVLGPDLLDGGAEHGLGRLEDGGGKLPLGGNELVSEG